MKAIAYYYRGKSMGGTFHLGDRLIISSVSLNNIKRGDVIVFHGKNRVGDFDEIVHRVVELVGMRTYHARRRQFDQ